MQQDLEVYRGGGASSAAPVAAPAPANAPSPSVEQAPNAPTSGIGADLAAYRAQKQAGTLPSAQIPKEGGSALTDFVKGIISAPATIVARPFQAAAAIAGASNQEIDEATRKIPLVGGLIAPTPNTFKDVEKDVGRAAQTVALGTGAPIAGGALFGAGASLEQGNDLLSAQTAFNTVLGAAGGKVLDLVGKPLLNATGKVIGVITPQTIKDVAAGGADAIAKFAAQHQLLGGIAAKPAAKLASGLQTVDDVIEGGVGKVFTGAKNAAAKQYPNASLTKHFEGINERDIVRPTTINKPSYAKATAVYNTAKARGIDLDKAATERRIIHDELIGDGKYNTLDTADNLRQQNYKDGSEIIRPALKEIEPGVALIPISDVRQSMIDRITSQPASKFRPEVREKMIRDIETRYADSSAEARAHPNGYSLTDLHDSRISAGGDGKYTPGVSTPPAVYKARLARQEEAVFKDLFDKTIPANSGLDGIRKEFEKNFLLADYLKALHGKDVPAGATKKAVRLFGRATGAIVGGKFGGFSGSIFGSSAGDFLFKSFTALPNPLKQAVLSRLQAEKSPAFEVLRKYLGEQETARLLRKALPAGGSSSYKEEAPTIFTTPRGSSTTNKGEAFETASAEGRNVKKPKTDRRLSSYLKKVDQAQQDPAYTPDKELPVIKAGTKPRKKKNLSDIY